MNCPVCPQTDLAADARTCPNCGVELAALRRLEQLPERYLNEAVALASRGESARAMEKAAAAIEFGAPPVRARLLLGKLLWNLGRHDDARDSWQRVLEADPENTEAAHLLATVGRPTTPAKAPAIPLSWIFFGVLLLGFGILLFAHLDYRREHSFLKVEVAHPPEASRGTVAGDLSGLAGVLARGEGFAARQEAGRVTVVFHEGLFRPGSDRFLLSASASLRSLANILRQHCRDCRVIVEGMTDASPVPPRSRWGDNTALAFARARRAEEVLHGQVAGVPLEWFAVTSGRSQPPYPNDTLENRAKNRTVVVHISPGPANRST